MRMVVRSSFYVGGGNRCYWCIIHGGNGRVGSMCSLPDKLLGVVVGFECLIKMLFFLINTG